MLKKLSERCFIGALGGLAISTFISIVISLVINNGQYYAVNPDLIVNCGSELNAVILQTVCSLIYGAMWAGASLIWENEDWSILRQTSTHLIITSMSTFLIANSMKWMDPSILGIVSYFSIFILIYLGIWIYQYFMMKKKIQELNNKVQQINEAQF